MAKHPRSLASRLRVATLAVAIGYTLAASPMSGSAARTPAKITDCFWQVEHGRDATIDCQFPTRLTEQEKADLQRLTRDRLTDATCIVSIRIPRSMLTEAIAAEDHDFAAPPQPVRCELVTRDGRVPINGTFSPRIEIRLGRAVDASPGLANIEGVPSYVAWPVVQYVNRSAAIRDHILNFVNSYRAHLAAKG